MVLPWTMFNSSVDHTFAKLFEEVKQHPGSTIPADLGVSDISCSLSRDREFLPSQRVLVDLSFNVVECCSLNGRYVRYEVAVQQEDKDHSPRNAFTVMMAASKQLKLPSKLFATPERYEAGRGDHRLHDDVIDFLEREAFGF